jgi:hypothetical protein
MLLYGTPSPHHPAPTDLKPAPTIVFILIIGFVAGVFFVASYLLLEHEPFWTWLCHDDRVNTPLLLYWLVLLCVIVPACPAIVALTRMRQIIARKLYHVLAVAMFLPASYYDV